MFVTPFGEPGFHRFWRLWNPLFGYALFRLYLAMGGRRRPLVASLVVFTACGLFLHDLVRFAVTGHFSPTTTAAFLIFWLLTVANRAWEAKLGQASWPRAANALVNVGGLALGLVGGALLARSLTS
jgi:Zn-dependent protease